MKYMWLAAVLIAAAVAATFWRYGSLDPCTWLERDTVKKTGLPQLVAQARIRAEFLLDGITAPDAGQCLTAWWDLRAEDASAPSK